MFDIFTNHLDLWSEALLGTLILFFGGALLALVLGFIVGAMRVSPVPIARAVGAAYVNLVRNTPLTLVFFIFVFAVPVLFPMGRTDYLLLGVLALGVYTATYVAEVLRSGINTVPVGQAEAARAIGLPFGQVMTLIVLPQAARAVVPPMMSVLIALLKNTTVAAGFSAVNLGIIRANMSERGENAMEVLIWVAIVFIVLVLLLSWVQNALERHWKVAR
ncbi:amino acid ABC transporter permease [Pseudoclavibacter sp. RFBJ3]|uniref:amino acid ABC transporter permease n=1 Tax=unclassified Pseudoclavibacter TaxID=2615177 RepID=UPI000CE7DB06|nr:MULTISPECIES: amino acid ABC transporter permease [unclassified Pseudoclavibacter]MBF4460660.1 amino acid ABC transporter permease [Pseudoclavibacter sp. VKM Ac-2867]MBF4552009.1 amino acid ABC transporter permease [Pseudoclavibacter sp. VKM Ac-2888]PPF34080.1 amino acid ABC transporter permease [Pseudoclavibacter sp. AY1H1]PPF76745.1 amino acid ABC transporter permease [Pseudoclavibacter sp. Z016]PPF85285.1 amino acid ABC transporter permease [Pseudoclavibacter sp. RFBJ5]